MPELTPASRSTIVNAQQLNCACKAIEGDLTAELKVVGRKVVGPWICGATLKTGKSGAEVADARTLFTLGGFSVVSTSSKIAQPEPVTDYIPSHKVCETLRTHLKDLAPFYRDFADPEIFNSPSVAPERVTSKPNDLDLVRLATPAYGMPGHRFYSVLPTGFIPKDAKTAKAGDFRLSNAYGWSVKNEYFEVEVATVHTDSSGQIWKIDTLLRAARFDLEEGDELTFLRAKHTEYDTWVMRTKDIKKLGNHQKFILKRSSPHELIISDTETKVVLPLPLPADLKATQILSER